MMRGRERERWKVTDKEMGEWKREGETEKERREWKERILKKKTREGV